MNEILEVLAGWAIILGVAFVYFRVRRFFRGPISNDTASRWQTHAHLANAAPPTNSGSAGDTGRSEGNTSSGGENCP